VRCFCFQDDGSELVLANKTTGQRETCPFNCNGVNASMLTTEVFHKEANGTGVKKRVKYRVKISHVSANFTQPLVWTSEHDYVVHMSGKN